MLKDSDALPICSHVIPTNGGRTWIKNFSVLQVVPTGLGSNHLGQIWMIY